MMVAKHGADSILGTPGLAHLTFPGWPIPGRLWQSAIWYLISRPRTSYGQPEGLAFGTRLACRLQALLRLRLLIGRITALASNSLSQMKFLCPPAAIRFSLRTTAHSFM